MDSKLAETNKKVLLEERKRLEKLLAKVADPSDIVKGDYKARYEDFGDKDDENASEVAQYEANIAEEKRLEEKLQKVNNALKRIEDGTYGIDINTGKEISVDRLRAVPEAETDIDHENH